MDQKLVMNCLLCFLIGFFFHSIMKFGFCGRNVEGVSNDQCARFVASGLISSDDLDECRKALEEEANRGSTENT